MSFGWSAGDIAQAIGLLAKVVEALDEVDGAASDYRDAVAFLSSLKRTLEPLQTISALKLRPAYREEIQSLVARIKEPVEKFLASTAKFEWSLGGHPGRYYQNVGRKLQWKFKTSKEANKLGRDIHSNLGILNNLMQQLILEMVVSMQTNLCGEIQQNFTQALDPRLITLLQEQLRPVARRQQESDQTLNQQYGTILSKIESHQANLQLFQAAQLNILTTSNDSQRQCERILSKLQEQELTQIVAVDAIKKHLTRAISDLKAAPEKTLTTNTRLVRRRRTTTLSQPLQILRAASNNEEICPGSLEDLYYLVLVYLGYFLRDVFLALSQRVRPTAALTPKLLAKYNISFYDALGRPPRVLDYDSFKSYKVFRAFLEYSFRNTPGSLWVEEDFFKLSDAETNELITPDAWSQMIIPGSRVLMAMLIEHYFFAESTCPAQHCLGQLQTKSKMGWKACSKCGMEVMTGGVEEGKFSQRRVLDALAVLKQTTNHAAIGVAPKVAAGLGNIQEKPERRNGPDTSKKTARGRSMFNEGVTFKRVEIVDLPRVSKNSSFSSVDTNFTPIAFTFSSTASSTRKFGRSSPKIPVVTKGTSRDTTYPLVTTPSESKSDPSVIEPQQKFASSKSSAHQTSIEMNRYWIPNLEICWKVISQEIQYYLGPESTIRRYTREGAEGFLITTPGSCFTDEQIDDICRKSKQEWEKQAAIRSRKESDKLLKRPLHQPIIVSRSSKGRYLEALAS